MFLHLNCSPQVLNEVVAEINWQLKKKKKLDLNKKNMILYIFYIMIFPKLAYTVLAICK